MTIQEAMRKFRLPNPSTPEDIVCHWACSATFGDRFVIAGHYFAGRNKPCYYGAVYEHLDDDLSCEGAIGLVAVSEVEFEDAGHALLWALQR